MYYQHKNNILKFQTDTFVQTRVITKTVAKKSLFRPTWVHILGSADPKVRSKSIFKGGIDIYGKFPGSIRGTTLTLEKSSFFGDV